MPVRFLLAVGFTFLQPRAFAANGNANPDALHFTLSVPWSPTGIDPDAGGTVVARFDQGRSTDQRLSILVSNLDSNAGYQLAVVPKGSTAVVEVAEFNTDNAGVARMNYVRPGSRSGSSRIRTPWPDALSPLSHLRELRVINASAQTVLAADLTHWKSFHYAATRALLNVGHEPGAAGSFRIKASPWATQFRLQATGLNPSRIYLLAMDGTVVDTELTDANGRLDLKAWPTSAPSAVDASTVSILDHGSNAVLSTSAASQAIPTDGLLLHYSFEMDAGATVADTSGNGRDGTVDGATWTSSGQSGGALGFNGKNNWVDFPTTGFPTGTQPRTLSAWVYQNSLATRYYIVGYGGDANCSTGSEFRMSVNEFAPGQFSLETNLGGWHSSASLSADTWTHLAITYDGATLRFYVNGEEFSASSTWLWPAINTTLGYGTLGDRPGALSSCDPGHFLDGKVDDVMIYNRALSDAEIQQVYQAQLR